MSKRIFYFDLFIGSFRESLFERLSLSLFMSRVGTNYYNASPSTDQSAFFTNFTNGGSYFHNCYSLTEFRIYFTDWKKISFLKFLNRELDPHEWNLEKPPNHSNLCCGVYKFCAPPPRLNHNDLLKF